MKFLHQYRKGFTLVELLVVIGVLGVLVAGILIAVNPAKQLAKARDADRIAAARQISEAINRYVTTHGKPPPVPTPGRGWVSNNDPNFLHQLVDSGELKSVPIPPNSRFGYYPYSTYPHVLVSVILESIEATTEPPQGSCRPFTGNRWCSSDVPNKYYCICTPY